MRHAFILTAGALSALILGAAAVATAGQASAAPVSVGRVEVKTTSAVEPVGCWWRRGVRYCSRSYAYSPYYYRRSYGPGIYIRIR